MAWINSGHTVTRRVRCDFLGTIHSLLTDSSRIGLCRVHLVVPLVSLYFLKVQLLDVLEGNAHNG